MKKHWIDYVVIIGSIATPVLVLVLTTAASPSVSEETMAWQIDGAIILKEEIIDAPIKTQVELRISIPRGTGKAALDAYLQGIYVQQLARDGFKARKNPNSVYVYVYQEGTPSDGAGWLGFAKKAASDDIPSFTNNIMDRDVAGARESLHTTASPGPMDTSVEETAVGLRVLLHHTERFSNSAYADESDMMFGWQRMFDAAKLLYWRVPGVDRVHIIVQHRKTVLIDAHLTAKTFAALRYDETMNDVMNQIGEISEQFWYGKLSSEEAEMKERQVDIKSFKTLIKRLPPDAIKFHPSVEL